jgi:RNA polymerase sigma-70 factor, ECF subfamily
MVRMQESSGNRARVESLDDVSTRRSLWQMQRMTVWNPQTEAGPCEPDWIESGNCEEPEEEEAVLPEAEQLRALVVRVQRHDDTAKSQLYTLFNRGIRFQLLRHLGATDIDDKVHDTFVIVLRAIMQNDLRSPERLLGYVRTIVRRQIASYIQRASAQRKEQSEWIEATTTRTAENPEEGYLRYEQRLLMRKSLSELSPRDREILVRFYIDEMPQEVICEQMELTMTQFRLLKSRAKARLSVLGQRQLRPPLMLRRHAASR